ncbi:RTA1 like protein [Lentinula raphanica]|nr:RTA1 like protein [Lentinula raphanica]
MAVLPLLTDSSLFARSLQYPYNYTPTEYVTIIFLVLFSVSLALHTGQAIYFRMWWAIPTMIFSGLLEVMGWSARFWSSQSPSLLSPYEMQLTCTILAPTPLLAGNFIILGSIIQQLGPKYSRISPWWYTIIFCSFDMISLLVQAVGGGMAATAVGKLQDPTPGGHIMLGGIAFQMATITVYILCALEFFFRYLGDKPLKRTQNSSSESKGQCFLDHDIFEKKSSVSDSLPTLCDAQDHGDADRRGSMNTKLRIMTIALALSTVLIFIRAIYRTIELTDGWSGRIISTQLYFNVLDGGMIVAAIYTMNIAHPGLLLDASVSLGEFGDIFKQICARMRS